MDMTLKELRERAESSLKAECTRNSCLEPEVHELAQIVLDLLDEMERKSLLHREEQRRSADRLRAALENQRTGRFVSLV